MENCTVTSCYRCNVLVILPAQPIPYKYQKKKIHSLLMKSLWCKLAYQPFLTQVQKFSNKVSNYVMLLLILILILILVDQIRHHNCSSLWYDGLWLIKQGTRELKLLNNYWLIKIDDRWKKLIALSPWSTKNLQYEKGEMHCNLNHA